MKKLFKDLNDDRQCELVERKVGDYWWEWIESQIVEELDSLGFLGVSIAWTGFGSQGDGASFTCKIIDWPVFWKRFKDDINFQSNQMVEWEEECKQYEWLIGAGGNIEDIATAPEPIVNALIDESIGRSGLYGTIVRTDHRHYHENSVSFNLEVELPYDRVEPKDRELPYQITVEDEKEITNFQDHLQSWIDNWIVEKNREIYRSLEKEWEVQHEFVKKELMESEELFSE